MPAIFSHTASRRVSRLITSSFHGQFSFGTLHTEVSLTLQKLFSHLLLFWIAWSERPLQRLPSWISSTEWRSRGQAPRSTASLWVFGRFSQAYSWQKVMSLRYCCPWSDCETKDIHYAKMLAASDSQAWLIVNKSKIHLKMHHYIVNLT